MSTVLDMNGQQVQPAQEEIFINQCAMVPNTRRFKPGDIVVHRSVAGAFHDLLIVMEVLIGQQYVCAFACPYIYRSGLGENPGQWRNQFSGEEIYAASDFGYVLETPVQRAMNRLAVQQIAQSQQSEQQNTHTEEAKPERPVATNGAVNMEDENGSDNT